MKIIIYLILSFCSITLAFAQSGASTKTRFYGEGILMAAKKLQHSENTVHQSLADSLLPTSFFCTTFDGSESQQTEINQVSNLRLTNSSQIQSFSIDTLFISNSPKKRNLIFIPAGFTESELPIFKAYAEYITSKLKLLIPNLSFSAVVVNVPNLQISDQNQFINTNFPPSLYPLSNRIFAWIENSTASFAYAGLGSDGTSNGRHVGQALGVGTRGPYTFAHELGHVFGLGDINDGNFTKMELPNVTQKTQLNNIAWKEQITPGILIPTPRGAAYSDITDDIGLYPIFNGFGSTDPTGWFKPCNSGCIMEAPIFGKPFCKVCRRAVDKDDSLPFLKVVNGSFGGYFFPGQKVVLNAKAPKADVKFSHWQSYNFTISNPKNPKIEITMPHINSYLEAVFVPIISNSNNCTDGAIVGIATSQDPDADGINNLCDTDDDNDGILDTDEQLVTITNLDPNPTSLNYITNAGQNNGGFINNPQLFSINGFEGNSNVGPFIYSGMMFGSQYRITGIKTQGRANTWWQYVTSYEVQATKDGTNWVSLGTYMANFDGETIVYNNIYNLDFDWIGARILPKTSQGNIFFRYQFELVRVTDRDTDNNGVVDRLQPNVTAIMAPTNLKESYVTETTLKLSWENPESNVGVTGYDVYMDGKNIQSVSTNTADIKGLKAGTAYKFYVVAIRNTNVSPSSNEITVSTPHKCTVGAVVGKVTAEDPDADGINNVCDNDDDNDGILDIDEQTVTITNLDPEPTSSNYINSGHQINNPKLNSFDGFVPNRNDGLAFSGMWFDSPSGITGVRTQGRGNTWWQYVTSYEIQATKDGVLWLSLGTFTGNSDNTTIVYRATKNTDYDWIGARIIPKTWSDWPSFRFQFELASVTDKDTDKNGVVDRLQPSVDADGDGLNDLQEYIVCRNDGNTSDFSIDFDQDYESTNTFNTANIANFSINNGIMSGTSLGDAQLYQNPKYLFKGRLVPKLIVKIKANAANALQLLWANEDGGFSEARSVTAPYTANNDWQYLEIDLSSHPQWMSKTIRQLRIDPANAANVNFEIDWIRAIDYSDCICSGNTTASLIFNNSGWSYYGLPSTTDPLFAIQHTPAGGNTNQFTAEIRLNKPCLENYGIVGITNFNTKEATLIAGNYWNISLTSGTTNGFVNIRHFSNTTLNNQLDTESNNFFTVSGATQQSPSIYFKTSSPLQLPQDLRADGKGLNYGFSALLPAQTGIFNGKNFVQFNQISDINNSGGGLLKRVTNLNENSFLSAQDMLKLKGTLRYNKDFDRFEGFDGLVWKPLH